MFLEEASRKTNAINAYVTGLGASKRVVIWDTLIQKTSNEETLFVVGHELGHYVLGHVWKGFLAGAEALLVARSEEHTSELQSQSNLVCRLLLAKKKDQR